MFVAILFRSWTYTMFLAYRNFQSTHFSIRFTCIWWLNDIHIRWINTKEKQNTTTTHNSFTFTIKKIDGCRFDLSQIFMRTKRNERINIDRNCRNSHQIEKFTFFLQNPRCIYYALIPVRSIHILFNYLVFSVAFCCFRNW